MCAYDQDESIAALQSRLINVDLQLELEQDHPGIQVRKHAFMFFGVLNYKDEA